MLIPVIALPLALVLFVVFLVAFPLVRQRARTGEWAVVVRSSSSSVESFVRWCTVAFLLAIAVWSVLVATTAADRLSIWVVGNGAASVGIVLLAVGLVLTAIAQAQMGASWRIGIDDEPTELVTSGLFRWMRHPIYTGIQLMFVGVVCLTPSPWTVGGLVVGAIVIGLQARLEEEHMHGLHGARFDAWAARVGRFLPGLGRLQEGPR